MQTMKQESRNDLLIFKSLQSMIKISPIGIYWNRKGSIYFSAPQLKRENCFDSHFNVTFCSELKFTDYLFF
jgi:hypothetical protein